MEKLSDAGLTKAIGLSNFRIVDFLVGRHLSISFAWDSLTLHAASFHRSQDLLTYARVHPAVNQIESQPYFTRKELIDECRRHNIQVVRSCCVDLNKCGGC